MTQTSNVVPARLLERSHLAAPPGRARLAARRRRALVQQALVLGAVALVLIYLVINVMHNLQAQGLASGFGFLWREAGFGIAFSLIPFDENSSYARVFLVGILNTLLVAGLGIVFATILGFVLGAMRVSPAPPLRLIALVYVEVLRNLPLLLVLIFLHSVVFRNLPVVREAWTVGGGIYLSNRGLYLPAPVSEIGAVAVLAALAAVVVLLILAIRLRPREPVRRPRDAAGVSASLAAAFVLLAFVISQLAWERPELAGFDFRGGLWIMPEFAALVLALVLYNAAFIAELVRGGIQSVDHGQIEAARALGFRGGFILRRIVLPQALRAIIPPITNQYTHLIKASSLAAVIGFPDLVSVFLGTSLNQTGRAIEIVVLTAAVYLTMSLGLAAVSAAYGRRIRLVER